MKSQLPTADFSITNTFLDWLTTPGNYKITLQDQSVGATSISMAIYDDLLMTWFDGSNSSNPTLEFPQYFSEDYTIRVIASNSVGADTLDSLISVNCGNLSIQPSAQCSWQQVGDSLFLSHTVLDDNSWDPNTSINGPGVVYNPWCQGSVGCIVQITQPGTYTFCGNWSFGTCSQSYPTICCDTIHVYCLTTHATWDHTDLGQLMVQFSDTGYANANPQYLWDFGDGNSSTQPSPLHTYAQNGTYTVCLTVTDSCGSDQICKTISVTSTGTTEPEPLLSAVRVSPNPSEGQFELEFVNQVPGMVTISVLDVQGKVLWSLEQWAQSGQHGISVDASLPDGYYLARLSTVEGLRHLPVQILH